MAKILIIGGAPKSLVNFRGHLIAEMRSRGHQVVACAGGADPTIKEKLNNMGVKYIPTSLQRASVNPFRDVLFFLELQKIIKSEKPDTVLSYTVKPVIYGSLAARLQKVEKIFALISGLGFAFIEKKSIRFEVIRSITKFLYKISLSGVTKVIFQNQDDLKYFFEKKILRKNCRAVRVNGSGVDLEKFSERPMRDGALVFLMIGRLLTEKGVHEFIRAAEKVKQSALSARFAILGQIDQNPSSIGLNELEEHVLAGTIEYWGETEDVRPWIEKSTVFVLPSYREGLPRSTLEAMAVGRPIITTDVPGCRDTVRKGENGILVPARDANLLAGAMIWCIENRTELRRMGKRSREIAQDLFDVNIVTSHLCREMGL